MAWTRTPFLHHKPVQTVHHLIHMNPLAVPLAVPLSVPVCFLPPHPLECPSLCQCPHFHHLPSLQPPPAPHLSKYLDMFLSLLYLLGQHNNYCMQSVCQVPLKLDEFICLLHRRPCDVTIAHMYIAMTVLERAALNCIMLFSPLSSHLNTREFFINDQCIDINWKVNKMLQCQNKVRKNAWIDLLFWISQS